MASGLEIERKFLVTRVPDLKSAKKSQIVQGYLAFANGSLPEVRLRKKGSRNYLTVKCGSGLLRSEVEVELSEEQFSELWPSTEGRRIEKVRSTFREGAVTVELDTYGANFAGFILAEVEFSDRETAEKFQPLTWMGAEVTGNRDFTAQALLERGLPESAICKERNA